MATLVDGDTHLYTLRILREDMVHLRPESRDGEIVRARGVLEHRSRIEASRGASVSGG